MQAISGHSSQRKITPPESSETLVGDMKGLCLSSNHLDI